MNLCKLIYLDGNKIKINKLKSIDDVNRLSKSKILNLNKFRILINRLLKVFILILSKLDSKLSVDKWIRTDLGLYLGFSLLSLNIK